MKYTLYIYKYSGFINRVMIGWPNENRIGDPTKYFLFHNDTWLDETRRLSLLTLRNVWPLMPNDMIEILKKQHLSNEDLFLEFL